MWSLPGNTDLIRACLILFYMYMKNKNNTKENERLSEVKGVSGWVQAYWQCNAWSNYAGRHASHESALCLYPFLFPMAPFFKVVHQSSLFCSKWSFVLRAIYQGFKSINRHRRVGIMWSDDYQSVAISSIYWWGLINHVKNSADINGRSCERKCIEIQWMIHHSENTQISIETSQKITFTSEILFNMFLQLCFTSSIFLSVFT